jgi:hypothetical protein
MVEVHVRDDDRAEALQHASAPDALKRTRAAVEQHELVV